LDQTSEPAQVMRFPTPTGGCSPLIPPGPSGDAGLRSGDQAVEGIV